MANTREIRDAAEKAENKAKEAAAKKEFEKAADYFTFAADAYLRIAKNLSDETMVGKCKARAGKLEQLSKQCRAAAKRGESKPAPAPKPEPEETAEEDTAQEPAEEPGEDEDELSLGGESEDETVEVDIPGEEDEEPEEETALSLTDEVVTEDEIADEEDLAEEVEEEQPEVDAPPAAAPPPAKPGVKIPKTKKLKRGPLPGKGSVKAPLAKKKKKTSQLVAPGKRKESKVVAAPKPAVVAAPKPVAPPPKQVEAPAPVMAQEDPEQAVLEEAPEAIDEPDMQGAPVLGKKDSERGRAVASDGDLEELADSAAARPASVVISLDAEDFPEQVLKPNEFSIDLSPRFTEHICKALTMGDVSQIATKFNKLADNLIRKAMGGDPRDELDLRFTALACREVADRLTAAPPGDPTDEIEKARKAYQRGDSKVAAELYKKAAVALLGVQDDSEEKTSKHERQASEYLSFSSRLRQVGQ